MNEGVILGPEMFKGRTTWRDLVPDESLDPIVIKRLLGVDVVYANKGVVKTVYGVRPEGSGNTPSCMVRIYDVTPAETIISMRQGNRSEGCIATSVQSVNENLTPVVTDVNDVPIDVCEFCPNLEIVKRVQGVGTAGWKAIHLSQTSNRLTHELRDCGLTLRRGKIFVVQFDLSHLTLERALELANKSTPVPVNPDLLHPTIRLWLGLTEEEF